MLEREKSSLVPGKLKYLILAQCWVSQGPISACENQPAERNYDDLGPSSFIGSVSCPFSYNEGGRSPRPSDRCQGVSCQSFSGRCPWSFGRTRRAASDPDNY